MDKEVKDAQAKEEKVNFSGGNLMKLDVSRGENIAELYVQENRLEEIDLTGNRKLKVLDCTGNPLKFIKGFAPSENPRENPPADELGGDMLYIEACRGGSVGLKYSPEEGQTYFAYPDEGYKFDGWYNALGDRISRESVWKDTYGAGREIFAMFIKL